MKLENINSQFAPSDWSHSEAPVCSLVCLPGPGPGSRFADMKLCCFCNDGPGGGGGGNKREVWREILEKQISPGQVCRAGGGERGPGHLAGSD